MTILSGATSSVSATSSLVCVCVCSFVCCNIAKKQIVEMDPPLPFLWGQ